MSQNKSSLRDRGSYKEVSSPNHQKSQNPQPLPDPNLQPQPPLSQIHEPDPILDFFHKNPSWARIASTKILGEATEEASECINAE